VVTCLETGRPASHECRILTTGATDGGALDLEVLASPLRLGETVLVVVALRDISAEKRRAVLERAFFHDLLNTAHGIRCAAEMLNEPTLNPDSEKRVKQELLRMANEMSEEIVSQRELLSAESGSLILRLSLVSVPELLHSVVGRYRHQRVARGRMLRVSPVPECALETDLVLLRRVLGNLVKNALEATPPEGIVTLGAVETAEGVSFRVQNPGVMPEAVQRQIFHRSFTTKGEPGRGIGTYSVKLLTERYLGGRVAFTTSQTEGTLFTVSLPRRAPRRGSGGQLVA
jgi:signal transduction histidine kinase